MHTRHGCYGMHYGQSRGLSRMCQNPTVLETTYFEVFALLN
jgi:hypothetical protein